jgi:hypothetical protein
MEEQSMEGKAVALLYPLTRPLYALDQSVYRTEPTGLRGASLEVLLASMEILLAGTGMLVLARRLWSGWRRNGAPPAEGLLLLKAAAYFVGISATLRVGWSRYALPTLLLGTILSGLCLAAVLRRLLPVELTHDVRTRLAPRSKPVRVEQRPLGRSRRGGVVTNGTASRFSRALADQQQTIAACQRHLSRAGGVATTRRVGVPTRNTSLSPRVIQS